MKFIVTGFFSAIVATDEALRRLLFIVTAGNKRDISFVHIHHIATCNRYG